MLETYTRLAEAALRDEAPTREAARWILDGDDVELLPLLHAAYVPRRRHFGRQVMVHVLNNVQNGLCPEDCGYCSQSKHSTADVRAYTMKSDDQILAEAEAAVASGASRYCMVLSGRGPSLEVTRRVAAMIREVKARFPIEVCLSAGLLDQSRAQILADAGLDRFNHNLNTSEAHYERLCTTHTYQDRLDTLLAAKASGLESCSGLIVGTGEQSDDIIEVAFTLRELEVPSIPVNFLVPIEGNPLQTDGTLRPEHCLRTLALMRLINPRAEIRAAAGREGHLRTLSPLLLWPANSLFVEGYLTTRGDAVRETYAMIQDAGFEIEGNPEYKANAEQRSNDFRLPGKQGILKPEIAAHP